MDPSGEEAVVGLAQEDSGCHQHQSGVPIGLVALALLLGMGRLREWKFSDTKKSRPS